MIKKDDKKARSQSDLSLLSKKIIIKMFGDLFSIHQKFLRAN